MLAASPGGEDLAKESPDLAWEMLQEMCYLVGVLRATGGDASPTWTRSPKEYADAH